MMRRSIIRTVLVLLLTLALSHISEGGSNGAKQIDITKQSDEIQPSLIEPSEFRVARDARRKLRTRRKGNNQNQKHPIKWKKKIRSGKKINKNSDQTKNKARQTKVNRMNLKKKENKNKGKITKNKKKSTKAEKKSKTNKIKHNKQHNNKKSGQQKKSIQNKKKLRKKWKNSVQQKTKKDKISKWRPRQACNIAELCQKIKDYIKYSNQKRKVIRIRKACDRMGNKSNKAATEFEATVTGLEKALDSVTGRSIYRSQYKRLENLLHSLGNARWRRNVATLDEVNIIKKNLQNCPITAKEKCQKSLIEPCQNPSLLTRCEERLTDWTEKFGPSKGSCLQKSKDCCTCITGLPKVDEECLNFTKKADIAVNGRNKCTNKTVEGSFGYCRNLQVEVSKKGSKYFKENCNTSGYVTKSPSGGKTSAMASASTAESAVPPAETASANPTSSSASTPVCKPQNCEVQKQGTKIMGGTVDTGPVPWRAHIPSRECGGSVIANNWIVTAAHCFYNSDGQQSINNSNIDQHPIKVGENMKELKPEKLFIHPQFIYGNTKHLNDIALVKVPAIDLTPVCLPITNNYDGDKATVYGWGSDDIFRKLDVIIQSDHAARQAYQNTISPLTNSQLRVMVFAGGEKDKDACVGDDGGPLTVGNELVGIVSWGLGCGVQGLPRAYTEVSFFKDWIIEKTNICTSEIN